MLSMSIVTNGFDRGWTRGSERLHALWTIDAAERSWEPLKQ